MHRTATSDAPAEAGSIRLRHVEQAMGTVFSFLALVAAEEQVTAQSAIGEAAAWLHEVDSRFTTFADSEWLDYTRGEKCLDDVHPDLRHVVERAHQLSRDTQGAFSLTADPSRPPDPAAYVKGWAVQRAAGLVLAGRAGSVMVNGGGDLMVTRRSEPWRVGIQDPHDPAGLVGVIELEHGAVATSGTYERGAHVFDPTSGRSSNTLASATVVGADLGLADAYSTALLATGEAGLDWFAPLEGYGAYLVRHDGSTVTSGAIRHS